MADTAWHGEQYARKNRFQRRWYKLMMVLASIVVFCTTYALILPAITLEQQCQIPEHQHTDDCYTQIATVSHQELTCHWDGHTTVIHQHDSYCTLQCELPEVEEHTHSEGCYQRPLLSEGHRHSDACYTQNRGELICQEHVHTESCYSSGTKLICTEQESDGHFHGEGCFDEEGNPICELEEFSGHSHGETCYETSTWRSCGVESDHVHTDDCYSWEMVRTCNQEECDPVYGDPVLICTKPEIIYHAHDDSCYDEEGTLICGVPEVLAHQHDASCWQTVEELADTETLTCGQKEGENHTHTARCRGTWVLTCGLEEHSHGDDCLSTPDSFEMPEDGATPVAEETTVATEETAESTSTPLKVESYIKGAKLSYKTKDSDWKDVSGETNIPGDASFKLDVQYENVAFADLIAAGYRMTFTPPEIFRGISVTGNLQDGSTNIGTITVENGVVLLTFNKTWVDKLQSDSDKNEGSSSLSGDFTVEARADLTSIPGDEDVKITVGNVDITINFERDLIAKYGEVKIEKKLVELEETEEGDFLNYTLTVTAGQDGCPDVVVKDSFTDGKQYVHSYVIPEECKDSATEDDGVLTWTIGKMEANEKRTLSYKVKLKEGYLGVASKDRPTLTNTANLYSGENERDRDAASFVPEGKATLTKKATQYFKNKDENGHALPGGYIQYTVWVHADENNNYVLNNVTIRDALDGSIDGQNKTDDAFLKYLSYDKNSFCYYKGGQKDQNGNENLEKLETTETPAFAQNEKSFTFNVGDLAPGESRVLIYRVNVDDGIYMESNCSESNKIFQIKNRVHILSDPKNTDKGNQTLEKYMWTTDVTSKTWAKKLIGEAPTEEEQTIPMFGTICDKSGQTITDVNGFTVPEGSYKYTVKVNEAGDWDVSSAVMKDTLSNQYMHYVGYVRVDAYQTDKSNPVKTVWVKIDGERNFSFTPKNIGLTDETCSYVLTYYAVPDDLKEVSTVIVANEFDLSGSVGINGNYYTLAGIKVQVSVTLQGSNYFKAGKNFWYYDATANEEGHSHGTMYWVIQAQGNLIPKGTAFKDAIADGTSHKLGSLVKAFIADSSETFAYKDLAALEDVGTSFTNYTTTPSTDGGELVFTLNQNVSLEEGKSLYFIVSTYPTKVPENTGNMVYKNALFTKDPGEGKVWQSQTGDLTYLIGGSNITKQLAAVYEISAADDDTIEGKLTTNDSSIKFQPYIIKESGAGVYVAWKVRLNQQSNLSGKYRIVDTIPKGMAVVYIQRYSTGQGYSTRPVFAQITDGSAGNEVEKTFSYPYDQNPTPTYYYLKGQQLTWEMDGLVADPAAVGQYYVDILIVCKVTDPDVLLGGETKQYTNTVTLSNAAGEEIGTGSADVELSYHSLKKQGTYNPETNGGVYPFEIKINELGTDLVPGGTDIKLIDEMCSFLILDTSTIDVFNSKTNEKVDYTAALADQDGKHILTLTLPDDQPLTIKYSATINAAPGQKITIENKAHWEGRAATEDSGVKEDNFSYAAGTVTVNQNPTVTVTKVDGNNLAKTLPGATFTLKKMSVTENNTLGGAEGDIMTSATGPDGTLTFGKDDEKLDFNTVYCLTETAAPEGYVLDETPHYFAVAKKEKDETNYPTFPADVDVWYTGASYKYQAKNYRGEITVEKKFANVDGTAIGTLSGTYIFGLFNEENPTGEPLKKATFTYANGTTVTSAVFKDVELGTQFYVYELNDNGDPILTGQSGTVSGIPFVVSYTGNGVTVDVEKPKGEVTVTNRINYPELPHTGGAGSEVYTGAGAALTAAALWLMYNQRKRRREGS